MKRALSITIGLGVVLTGCVGSEDIVARTALEWVERAHERDTPERATDAACSPQAARVVLITKAGRLITLQPETAEIEDLGIPSCLQRQAFGLAIDHNGAIWVQPNIGNLQVIDPISLDCTERELKLEVGLMAFVYDPATQTERLYVSEIDTLSVIDPNTLERTRIGSLETPQPAPELFTASTRSLTGTRDGQLFAVSDGPGSGKAAIGRVDLATGRIQNVWPSVDQGVADKVFIGGVIWRDDFILGMVDVDAPNHLNRFSTESEQTSLVAAFELQDDEPYAIASSTCASLM